MDDVTGTNVYSIRNRCFNGFVLDCDIIRDTYRSNIRSPTYCRFTSDCHGWSEAARSPAPEAEPWSTQPALRHPNSASLGCSAAALSYRLVAITSSPLATSSPESNQQKAPPLHVPQWLTASSLPRNWFAGKMFALHDWHEIPTAPNTVSFRYKITSVWVTKLSTSQLAVSLVPVYLRNPLPRKRLRASDLTEIAYGFVTYRIASNFKITCPSEHLNV